MPILHRSVTVTALAPRYTSRFACTGPACPDTCCAGWQVALDKKTYKAYRHSGDALLAPRFARKLERTDASGDDTMYARMVLDPGTAACPMLQDKLCSVQARLGESYLSNTCAQYPRVTRVLGAQVQQAMQLSCPEAARLALLAPDAFEFDAAAVAVRPSGVLEAPPAFGLTPEQMDGIRVFCLNLMRTDGLDLGQRLALLGVYCERLEQHLSVGAQDQLLAMTDAFAALVEQGTVAAELGAIAPDLDAQAMVFATLLGGRGFATPSAAQAAVNARVAAGLGADAHGQVGAAALVAGYRRGIARVPEALRAAPHLLDHYLLNEMFTHLFPFDQESPYQSYLLLVARFGVLRLMLAAQCNTDGALPDAAALVQTVQVHCRRFQHDDALADGIKQCLVNSGWVRLDKLFGFLR